jgi:hypothetical protein
MQDARWVHRNFLRSVFSGQIPHKRVFSLPGKSSISSYLLRAWASEDPDPQWAGSDVPTVAIDEGSSFSSGPADATCFSLDGVGRAHSALI